MKKEVFIIAGIVVLLYLFSKKKKNNMPDSTEIAKQELKDALLFNKMMKDAGITNRFARWGIMAIIGKESGFEPVVEKCYNNTSAVRIKNLIFPTRLGKKTDAFVDALKKDCKAFFNYVYGYEGNDLGNIPGTDDGYIFRGRGLNQLTGRGNYDHFGKKLGLDLVNNPELVNVAPNYFAITLLFFLESGNSQAGKSTLKNRLGISSINDFKDIDGAIRFFANANAGIGKSWNSNVVNMAVTAANKNKTKYKLLSL